MSDPEGAASTPPAPRIGRSSAILASGTLVSRLLGFVSAIVLARTIGTVGDGPDAFAVANTLPNYTYAIIAGGLLTAILVPQIVRASVRKDGGEAFVNSIVTLGIIIFGLAAIAATFAAPALVRLYSQFNDSQFALAVAFAYWCLPQIFFYALFSLLGEVLNARGVFGPFAWAPALNNLIVIVGLLVFQVVFGQLTEIAADEWTSGMIALLGGTVTLGIASQALVLFLFWKRAGMTFRPHFRWRGLGLRKVGKSAGWIFGMVLVTQAAGIAEVRVASDASGDGASNAILNYAWLMTMLPHSIVTVSIATVYFTSMSRHATDNDLPAVRSDLSASLRTILLFVVFAAGALAVLALPFSAVFAKSYDNTVSLALVFWASLFSLLPFSTVFVLQRALFALEHTRTAFLLQAGRAILFIGGSFAVATLPKDRIVIGLALLGASTITLQAIAAGLILRRRLDGIGGRRLAIQIGWYVGALIPALAAGVGVLVALGWVGEGAFAVSSVPGAVVTLAVAGLTMLAVYLGILALTKNPEFRTLATPVMSQLRGIARR